MTWNPKDDIYKHFAQTPDQQLLVWEDWIKIREHEVVKLGFRTMRPPADLTMNLLEKYRPKLERKKTLQEGQIAIKPRLRGFLWEQPNRLKQACPCDNVYEVQRTAAELCKPRVMEHVLCPNYIQQHEKGLIGDKERVVCSKLNATYEEYRQHREEVHKEKISKIDPYRPDMKELIIIGRKPITPPKKRLLPEITVTPLIDHCPDPLSEVYALRINQTITIKNLPGQDLTALKKMQREQWHENNCYSWTYYFNVPENRIGRGKLFIENLGTVTLRYCWKKIRKNIPYIPDETYEQKFFFNKNEDVIFPGQRKTICFTFVSAKAGIYNEYWELALMNISLFDTLGDKFSVHLVGDAVENIKKISRKIEKLEIRIDRKVIRQFLFNLLDDIITQITGVQHEIYPYKKWLLEADLFVARNIQHYYHQTEVHLLKEMYRQMRGLQWDLSLLTWRDTMFDIRDFDERMKYYDQLKKSHVILLAPWSEGDELLTEKHRAVKLLLGQLVDKFNEEFDRVSEWNGIVKKQMEKKDPKAVVPPLKEGPLTNDIVHNIFYIRMYDHVATTMETIAGVISSLDLNRCIEFDFCQF